MPEEVAQNHWRRTLAETAAMAEELVADGWSVTTVRAGHVSPEPPGHGDSARFGFVYVAQGSDREAIEDAVAARKFDDFATFNHRDGSDLYTLTRIADEDRQIALLLVGVVDLARADGLVDAAREHGEMYSHVQLLDGTHLASFHHDDHEPFVPEEL